MSFWPRLRTSARPVAAALVALASLSACRGGDPETRVVAEVGDREINAGQVADYMVGNRYGLTREEVSRAVDEMVNLLLMTERARARYTPTNMDSFQMKEWSDILTISQYREDVLWKTVAVDTARLKQWYDENVSEQVQARHILLSVPPEASDAERAAVRHQADSLLQVARGGADFAELARAHSQDRGSAENGGLLRWFGKGEMVPPFEEAAFKGEAGEVYPEVVESQFGFHIIKVEGKKRPSFEDVREDIEEQLMGPERFEAEQAFVTRLMENSQVEFLESNVDTLIALIDAQPEPQVTGPQRALELATFRGGAIVLGEIWDIYQTLPEANRAAIAALDQTRMVQALASLVQQRLLLEEARTHNVTLDSTRQRQLDDRIDRMYAEGYMREVARSRIEVTDPEVAQYYDEHREFYAGQSLDEVREQIRDVISRQRFQELQAPDTERRIVAAVADSQATEMKVVRHEDRFDEVLEVLRARYEEAGLEPAASSPPAPVSAPASTPAPAPTSEPAGDAPPR